MMNQPDFFSFLDPDNNAQDDSPMLDIAPSTSAMKRKVPSRAGSPQQEQQSQVSEDENKPGPSKKARIASPRPVVMDDVEIEAKREVPASAGLQGAAVEAGAKLELRHQVSIAIS